MKKMITMLSYDTILSFHLTNVVQFVSNTWIYEYQRSFRLTINSFNFQGCRSLRTVKGEGN